MSKAPSEVERRGGVVAIVLTIAAALIILTVPTARDFFDEHLGASLAIIAVAVGVLAWSGLRLIASVHEIASATRSQAEASQAAGPVPTGPIPVIAFELSPEPRVNQFNLRVENVGNGPALDLEVALIDSPLDYRQHPPARGRALGPGGVIELTFVLQEEAPFRDPAHGRRWPRDEADAAAISDAAEPPRDERTGVILDPSDHLDGLEKLQERYGAYRRDVLAAIAEQVSDAGVLTARYHDLGQVQRISSAPLSIGRGSRPDRPGAPDLGTLRVEAERATIPSERR